MITIKSSLVHLNAAQNRANGALMPVDLIEASVKRQPVETASLDMVVNTCTIYPVADAAPSAGHTSHQTLKHGGIGRCAD